MKKFRDVSPVEFSYLARDTGKESPFVNQFFVEGKGRINKEQLQQAVHLAHQKNPGISLTLKGRWAWRYWQKNTLSPEIFEYNGAWQGNSSAHAEVINMPFNARTDILSSIILFTNIADNENVNFKILFRVHHAICDGVATLHWIQEIFRALRKETLLGSSSQLSELDIVQRENYETAENLITESKPVFPVSKNPELRDCLWIKYRWQGKDSKILAKLIFILKEITEQQHEDAKTIFRVPSDLRRYLSKEEKAQAQLSNLSGLFDLRIEKGADINQIQNEIVKAMRGKKDISVYPKKLTAFTKYLPSSAFQANPIALLEMHAKGLCNITGMISYVGKINLDDYSCENFTAQGIYAIPMALEDKSIYIGLLTDANGIQVVISAPKALANAEQVEKLASEIEGRLAVL